MKDHKDNLEFEKAFDRVVFGTNNPKVIEKKVGQMALYLQLENSSLGHSLAGIRHRRYWSLETAAEKAGVPLAVWRNWESDLATPTPAELQAALKRLGWLWALDRFMALRSGASRVQLRRLTNLSPNTRAARGISGISGSYEWQSLNDELKARLTKWGEKRELVFPDALVSILASFDSDEEREAWINDVLGEDTGPWSSANETT